MLYINIICIVIIVILIIALYRKQILDTSEKVSYEKDVAALKKEKIQCEQEIAAEQQKYEETLAQHYEEIEEITSDKWAKIDSDLNKWKKEKIDLINGQLAIEENKCNANLQELQQNFELKKQAIDLETQAIESTLQNKKCMVASICETIANYEKEKESRLYYTIQLPEEYQPDIDYLLTDVKKRIEHPDIISKLVWAEYIKPYLDDTFKRCQIEDKPGIYKLTNINNQKSYIGKSTNVKKRIADHFKSSIGIESIAKQAVHGEIFKEGFWNWTIEVITYCDKEELGTLEKYYIDFFKTKEYGYNKVGGG